jgi:hypothetical protein
MLNKPSEKGQALVIIALAAVGLFAFTALAIDGGMVFSDRRHAQNAADTSALAAALAKARGQDYSATGLARATSNGYANDSDSIVEVYLCNDPGITTPCQGLPAGADPSEYIQVKITSIVRTVFARIVGRQTVTNIVTAVARAVEGGPKPLFEGSALVALAENGTNTIGGNGNILLDVNNSGVFDNSADPCAMGVVGNGTYTVDTAFSVAGTLCQNGNNTINGPVQTASQVPYPPNINIPTPSITCSGNGSVTADDPVNQPNKFTIHPGNFPGLTLNNGNYTFMAGSYCFNGDVRVNGNSHITANFVDILITSGDFQINANSTFNCDYMLVHIDGGTGMRFNGNGSNTCTNVTFFAETGSVSWNGNVANTFTAPTSGPHPEYENLLIYMPYGNTSPLTINGNSGNNLTGSIIAVSSNVTIAGNSGTTGLHSSITGYTITLAGNSNTTINYVPDEQFTELDPSSIELTK